MIKTGTGKSDVWGDHCHRCGGLMVPEQVLEIRSMDFRCVSCGERIDPVILTHREKYFIRNESKTLMIGQ